MHDDLTNWNARLLKIAEESPDAPGQVGAILRATLAQHAAREITHGLQLAHARAREAVVSGTRMALRCGSLLLKIPPKELPGLLCAAGISPQAAESYVLLAQQAGHELRARSMRKRGCISEMEALRILRGSLTPDPVTDLQALLLLNDK